MARHRLITIAKKTVAITVFIACSLMLFLPYVTVNTSADTPFAIFEFHRHSCEDEVDSDDNHTKNPHHCKSVCHVNQFHKLIGLPDKFVVNAPLDDGNANTYIFEKFSISNIACTIFKPPKQQ